MSRKSLILILTSAFVLTLGAWIEPIFIRARNTTATNVCVSSLVQIQGAKEQWALEYKKTTNDIPSWDDLRPYIGRGPQGDLSGLRCQKGGSYTVGRVGVPPTCSIGGPDHSLVYDYSKETHYSNLVGLLCLLSFFGLLVIVIAPRKLKDQDL